MKKIFALILALVTVLSLCACGKDKYAELAINVAGFGQNIVNGCSFDIVPETAELNADAIRSQLDALGISADDLKETDGKPEFFYATTGEQSADFVMVIGAKDAETAKKLSDGQLKTWLDNLRKDSSYHPAEAPKLENCINKTAGRYVFVICSKDSAAAESALTELLDNAVKQNV